MSQVLGPNELALHTRKRRQIANEIGLENDPSILRHAIEDIRTRHPDAQLRSISATYNCVGMVVASRRALVDPDQMQFVLNDDDFRRVGPDEVREGDVVLYREGQSLMHVGIVARRNVDLGHGEPAMMIYSKWGEVGEYLHAINDVPSVYGVASEFWTDRKVLT